MSLKKNFIYNLIYQIMTLFLPLITVPYLSRTLKTEGAGIYAYTFSLTQYFVMLGMLGISIYGNKIIAINRFNRAKLSNSFFSIYFLQLFLSFLSTIGYLIFVLFFFKGERSIALIQTIVVLSTIIDCSWFFSGLEEFKKVLTRNIVIKILSLIGIFIFVKTPDDLPLYTLIMGLSSFLSQLVMWFYIKKYIDIVRVKLLDILQHLKPTFVYFLPQIAVQVYAILNKTMIGLLSTKSEVGIYDYSDKIIKIALTIVTSLGVVMFPRIANIFANGEVDRVKQYIIKSLDFSTMLAVPIMFGLAGIANEFVPWYMGNEFIRSIDVIIIMSPVILLMSWSGVFGVQYLMPLGRMKAFSVSLYIGAIFSLTLNLFLIRTFGSVGSAFATLGAEIAVTVTQLFFIKNEINMKKIIPKVVYYLFSGIIMYAVVRFIGETLGVSFITTFIQILAGGIVYIMVVILFELSKKDGLILNEVKKRRILSKD